MIERIRAEIQKGNNKDALKLIEHELAKPYDLGQESQFDIYTKLLHLRVAAQTMSGDNDAAILELARKERYPHIKPVNINSEHTISFIDRNISVLKCDAVVNSIHKEKHFDYSPISYSRVFLQTMGQDVVDEQTREELTKQRDGFIILHHDHLPSPMSYHIPAYYGDLHVDTDALCRGIVRVLDHAHKKGIHSLAFAPIGMSCTDTREEKALIIEKIAETITTYLRTPRRKFSSTITFAFSNFDSFEQFVPSFERRSAQGEYLASMLKGLTEKQQLLIKRTATGSVEYMNILKEIAFVAEEPTPILLLGETGVGKSFLAERIHEISGRSGTFRSRNCAAMTPEQLILGIYGNDKAAFSGVIAHDSIFETAEGGTVFLDEIGLASMFFQQRMLTFLDSGRYLKEGAKEEKNANVRLIFGTNQNLDDLVKKGTFMPDFHARIALHRVFTLPPLRTRPDDIPPFAASKLETLHEDAETNNLERAKVTLTAEALELLKTYPWPGNVRQLVHYVENLYYNAQYANSFLITAKMIQASPPRTSPYNTDDPVQRFRSCVLPILDAWNPATQGKFLRDFVEPIVAKVFIDDLERNKTDSNEVLGMDGNKSNTRLTSALERFISLDKKS